MQRKYQVFISSTFRDLIDERQDAIRSILEMGHLPAGMEAFPAADSEQFVYIKKVIDECDYYVLIVGARYGSESSDGISYTRKEYEYAVETGKTVLGFVHGNPDSLPVLKADTDVDKTRKLQEFRDVVATGRLIQFWNSREDLRAKVIISLHKAFLDSPGIGWVRGNVAAQDDLLREIHKMRAALDEETRKNAELSKSLVPAIPNLAEISDETTIYYTVEKSYGGRPAYRSSESENVPWIDIFVSLADDFMVSHTDVFISRGIKRLLEKRGNSVRSFILNEDCKVIIKRHLEALGLFQVFVARTTDGKNAEFIRTTELGKRILVENVVQRKAIAN